LSFILFCRIFAYLTLWFSVGVGVGVGISVGISAGLFLCRYLVEDMELKTDTYVLFILMSIEMTTYLKARF